jgi:hypothetical protein
MADRFPLVAISTQGRIAELPIGDNLNLSNAGIVSVSSINATNFIGNLTGTASTASFASTAYSLDGFKPNELNVAYASTAGIATIAGYASTAGIATIAGYASTAGIATYATYITNAANITGGTLPTGRLTGSYNIDITGTASNASNLSPGNYNISIQGNAATATTATYITDAANITGGTLPTGRLTGSYNIAVSYATTAGISTNASYAGYATTAGISTNASYAGYATTAGVSTSVIGGIASITALNVSGITTLGITSTKSLTSQQLNVSGITTLGITSTTSLTSQQLNVSGITTLGITSTTSLTSQQLNVSGITTLGITSTTSLTSQQLNVSGVSTLGILTVGNIYSSGIITATSFVGNVTGNVTGIASTAIYAQTAGVSTNTTNIGIGTTISTSTTLYPVLVGSAQTGAQQPIIDAQDLKYNAATGALAAVSFLGDGSTLSGIVTQITAGIGIDLSPTNGKTSVQVQAYRPVGKTIHVAQNGDDNNTGLAVNHPKRTIKAAAATAFPGDTIKVFPGVYVENNPIVLNKTVSIEGTELRNCIVTPAYTDRDLFYVNNGVHMTNLSFIGPESTNGAAIVSLQPLLGISTGRYFDATRLLRLNLNYIAQEAVGYFTSTQYRGGFYSNLGITSIANLKNNILKFIGGQLFDITRGGNSKTISAVIGFTTVSIAATAAIDLVNYATGIQRAIINNVTWGSNPVGLGTTVINALYNNITGITTITATNHGLLKDDAVRIVGLGFTCTSGPGIVTYPSGNSGYIFNVKSVVGVNTFEVIVGQSTLPHTYVSGGTVQKYENFQNNYTQIKDLAIQPDPITGFNNGINGCANVVSAIYSYAGIATSILGNNSFVGITTRYSGNLGIGFTTILGISTASYDNTTGNTILTIPGLSVVPGDSVEIYNLNFSCNSGGGISTQAFPSGKYGYEFYVNKVNTDGSFIINTGVSTLAHTYVGGGFAVNRSIGITTAIYDRITGITTITANGAYVKVGDMVTLIGLGFTCSSGPGIVTYPSGKSGYTFPVTKVIGTGTTFAVQVGVSTLAHTYVGGGVVKPTYSRGVGPITQGPYIRNCTNFIGKSIGLKVDGIAAEPGDQDDIGVTGTMSVDSYTQYNQNGIGVSITNGAYAQLVSIFTIADDIAIYTASGGQCDITNSNSSFGNYGLYSTGVSDPTTKSIYRSTGVAVTDATAKTNTIIISGVGTNRPYDGQSCYFGQLYYSINTISVTNAGSGYVSPPKVTISTPEGSNGVTAQASSTIDATGKVTAINLLTAGTQYIGIATVTIDSPGVGVTATATVTNMQPIYYYVSVATLPSAGISTVSFLQTLNNTVSAGTTVYFARKSSQLASTISFEYVGAGTNIFTAKPSLGGVVISENKVVQLNGGTVTYTSTDQSGNFNIGDGVTINQATGQISGRDFTKALFTTMTPFILALSD